MARRRTCGTEQNSIWLTSTTKWWLLQYERWWLLANWIILQKQPCSGQKDNIPTWQSQSGLSSTWEYHRALWRPGASFINIISLIYKFMFARILHYFHCELNKRSILCKSHGTTTVDYYIVSRQNSSRQMYSTREDTLNYYLYNIKYVSASDIDCDTNFRASAWPLLLLNISTLLRAHLST